MNTRLPIAMLFLLVWTPGETPAQTLFNSGSKITVSSNTSVTVKGDVTNNGTLTNDGHLKVSGPWVNSGVYVAGNGQITFNGTSTLVPQLIHHNGQTFNRVTISGGTKKILLSDVVIGQAIAFDDGIIEGAGDASITFNAGVSINNASDRSHVHGTVYHRGAGQKLFPLGNGYQYLPVELPDIDDPSSVVGVQAFEFQNVALGKPTSLEAISDKRYWYIDVRAGAPRTTVILPLKDESWYSTSDKLVVVQSASPDEIFSSIGRSFIDGARTADRVQSESAVSKPFVSLAMAAAESELVVYNAISLNGDGLNDYLRIDNIENYPENRMTIFNRWGDKVFEIGPYDNEGNAFRGRSNVNGDAELVSGSYFYVLDLPGRESLKGFLTLKN